MCRRTIVVAPLLVLALLLVAIAESAAQAPAELASIADRSTVMLTTVGRKSGQPRSVPIWFVVENGRVFLQAGNGGKTDWYENLRQNPTVTLDFSALVLSGRAQPIDDPAETKRVHDLFLKKYWQARVSNWFGGDFGTGKVVMVEPLERK